MHNLLQGHSHTDERGKLHFFNTFNMNEIVRFYEIIPKSIDIVRAWQGHKDEKKWFYCSSGSFLINLIKVDDFKNPSLQLEADSFMLEACNPTVLEVPGGYATGFKATGNDSKLIVYSNFSLEESKQDDYRYPVNKWKVNWQLN